MSAHFSYSALCFGRPSWGVLLGVGLCLLGGEVKAQSPLLPNPADLWPSGPPPEMLPDTPVFPTDPLLNLPLPDEETSPPVVEGESVVLQRLELVGNTVFGDEELQGDWQVGDRLSVTEVMTLLGEIDRKYEEGGYITSGSFVDSEDFRRFQETGILRVQVREGGIEEIRVRVEGRLHREYVRSRLNLATTPPLHEPTLLDGLRLLQLDPMIEQVQGALGASPQGGQSVLDVVVVAANPWFGEVLADNGRSPSVGSFRRGVTIGHRSLSGWGDRLQVGYSNTEGSNSYDFSYTVPVSPHNTTVNLTTGIATSRIIEPPFVPLNVESTSRYTQLKVRHPLKQTPSQEFALSLALSRTEGATRLLDIPFPLSPGADAEGKTQITALRLSQEWTQQSHQHILALRSQFSLGLDALGATINSQPPDTRFFAWRGQGQYVRLIGDSTLIVRGNVQWGDRPLVPSEQLGMGGFGTVRGYRQDTLLTDHGISGTVEWQFPVLRLPQAPSVLVVAPFVDFGLGWNQGSTPDRNTLASVGLGLQWLMSDRLVARLDWGIPLTSPSSSQRTWQENGLHFSIQINPF
ncbi:BamA/TamA family outer membrane protein [Spirulina subsalsa FACHB-351]|uniref:BamA/TamA family outer membrane protein n=1 Tax=Spirulina subsalsa FACHB-351 TaxID=234711 RepID=A0ABT3L390_9CYAN|nr:ShlB/FhaC/HecB family hemolysin secretion/activation protein [Spirulina subsalsa]MCW6035974.1 BamA/TamA family outer membrane protein [Spirulina subsalsa FACHB-351]